MSKGLKIFLWVLVILVVLAIIAFFWAKNAWDKISFSAPRLQGLDLNGLTLNDLVNIAFTGQSKPVTVTLGMDIVNKNNFSISFSKMNVKMFYQGTLIAESSPALAAPKVVPANGSLSISDTITITLNNAGGQLLIEKITNKKPVIDYVINISVFGLPLPSIKNNFVW